MVRRWRREEVPVHGRSRGVGLRVGGLFDAHVRVVGEDLAEQYPGSCVREPTAVGLDGTVGAVPRVFPTDHAAQHGAQAGVAHGVERGVRADAAELVDGRPGQQRDRRGCAACEHLARLCGQHDAVDDAREHHRSEPLRRPRGCVDDLLDRKRLQVLEVAGRHSDLAEHEGGELGGVHACADASRGAALADRAVEQAIRRGHGEQDPDLLTAARLTEHRDVAGVTAERRDLVPHPLERGGEIEEADHAGRCEVVAHRGTEVQQAEHPESVVDPDHHDVTATSQLGSVVERTGRGARVETAAVQPHHHRAAGVVTDPGGPHVEHEAVFALLGGIGHPVDDLGALAAAARHVDLRTARPEVERVTHPDPRFDGRGCTEAARTCRGRRVRHPLERPDAVSDRAAHAAERSHHVDELLRCHVAAFHAMPCDRSGRQLYQSSSNTAFDSTSLSTSASS